jgi:cysteine desulfurase
LLIRDHLHGPKGTGGIHIKQGLKCSPFIYGGIEQGGYRAGSFNMAGLAALGQAAKETLECRDLLCTEVARLRNKLENSILENVPDTVVFYREQERIPNCTAIGFPGIANEALLFALNRKGVYACIGGGSFQQIGLVLTAGGIPVTLAECAINFSLSRETTEDDIDRAIEVIIDSAKRLRRVSSKLVINH